MKVPQRHAVRAGDALQREARICEVSLDPLLNRSEARFLDRASRLGYFAFRREQRVGDHVHELLAKTRACVLRQFRPVDGKRGTELRCYSTHAARAVDGRGNRNLLAREAAREFVARYLQIEGADLAQALKLVLLGSGEDCTPRGVREMRSTALDDVQMAVVNELKIVAILVELRDVPVVASYPLL